jgi:hypothetical protein
MSPLVSGCGAAAGAQSVGSDRPLTVQRDHTTERDISRALVLKAKDLGEGYVSVNSETRSVPLSEELKHESAIAREADRRSYLGGFDASYTNRQIYVFSKAATYRNAADARVSFTDAVSRRYGLSSLNGRVVPTPAIAPGLDGTTVVGYAVAGSQRVPIHAYLWLHSNGLGAVAILGRNVTIAQLMRLARAQDAKYKSLDG